MKIRRSLATTALSTLALGSVLSPVVLGAVRTQTQIYTASKKAILLNGHIVSTPIGLVGQDKNTHRPTTYMPLWYVLHALKATGVQYTWNGSSLNVTPGQGMPVNLGELHPGNEPVHLSIDGTLVDTTYRVVARDPYSGVYTTYLPIWYVQYLLKHMGVMSQWNGRDWNLIVSEEKVVPTKLNLSASNAVTKQGQADSLSVSVTNSNGTTQVLSPSQINWSTSDPNHAFISQNGQFVATEAGTFTVTAAYQGLSQSVQIRVTGNTETIRMQAQGPLVANGVSTQSVLVNATDSAGQLAQNENGTVLVTADKPWIVTGSNNGTSVLGESIRIPLTKGIGKVTLKAPAGAVDTVHLSASQLSDAQGNVVYNTLSLTSTKQVASALAVTPLTGQYLAANTSGNTASFAVSVLDQTGHPMESGTYTYQVHVDGSASYNGPSTLQYHAGVNNQPIVVESKEGVTGPVTVEVSAPGMHGASASIQAIIAKTATQLVAQPVGSGEFQEGGKVTYQLVTQGQNGVPVSFPTSGLRVYVTNPSGKTATNIVVDGVKESGSGVEVGTNRTLTLGDTSQGPDAGTYQVSVRDASNHTLASFQVREDAAVAKQLILSAAGNQVTVRNPSTTLTLQYKDAYGNLTHAPTSSPIVVKATGGQGKATINGQDAANGVKLTPNGDGSVSATFSAQPYAGSLWKVFASDGGLSAQPVTIAVVNAKAKSMMVSLKDDKTGSTSDGAAGDGVALLAGATDEYGNAYTGNDQFQVQFPSGDIQSVSGAHTSGSTAYVSGSLQQLKSDFTHASVTRAGQVSVSLKDLTNPGLKAVSSTFHVTPGAYHGFGVFDQTGLINSLNPLKVTAAEPVEVWLKPVDAFGNAEPNSPVSATLDLSDGTNQGVFRVRPAGGDVTQVGFSKGAGSEAVFYLNQPGSYQLTASVSVLDPSQCKVTMSNFRPFSSDPDRNGSGILTVVLKDTNGYPVTGQASTLKAIPSADGVSVGPFVESQSRNGTYTAKVTTSKNQNGVTITVKDGATTVGVTQKGSS